MNISNIFGTLGFGISRRVKMPVNRRKDLWRVQEGVVTDRTCREWFAAFLAGGFSCEDAPGANRPVAVESHQVQMFTEDRPREATRETGHMLKIPKSIVENHLHQDGNGPVRVTVLVFGFHTSEGGKKTNHHS